MKILIKSILLLTILTIPAFGQNMKAEKYGIEQYLRISSASQPTFSPDGRNIAYLTNATGTNQVWIIPASGGEPKQLTNYEDNVSFVEFSPREDLILFGKASGGDENAQLFLMRSDGSNVKQLTNNPNVRNNFGEWSKDGRRIFYASNKRDRNYFDIYMMEIPSGREELILQQDGNNSVAAVSDDGNKIIVSRSGTELSLDNNLYLLNVAKRKAELLTQHSGAARFGDVHFLPETNIENTSFIYGTDHPREFYTLGRMDITPRQNKNLYLNELTWDVDATAISPDGRTVVYTYNREGFSEFHVRETNAFAPTDLYRKQLLPAPGKGVIGGLEFSPDARFLAFTFSSPKHNGDIWIYDLQAKKFSQLTQSSRAGIPQESFVEPELIKFKSFDGREIPAWFYRPKVVAANLTAMSNSSDNKIGIRGGIPVIVSVHGGPEGQERPGFNALYQYYLSRGYAILATNVRGSTGYGRTYASLDDVQKREDSVKDLAAAAEWLKTQRNINPQKIAVMGGSYGGYMTMAAITLYPDLWAAAVNTVGIVNFETFLQRTSGYRRRQREVEYGRLDKDLEFLRAVSPIHKVDRIKTPLMVIHGKRDPRVPYTEAEQIVAALKKRGAVVEYKLFEDEGHGISKLKNRLVVYPLVADFLDKHLKQN